MRIPFFNKIYGSIKQVNDAFTVGGTNSFKKPTRKPRRRQLLCLAQVLHPQLPGIHSEQANELTPTDAPP